jgi:S1-C subfamily serine protease
MTLRLLFVSALLVLCNASAVAAEKAWYGFHIDPKTEGFPLNPVVRSVMIDKIKAGSPADAQKMRVGDEIIEAEGRVVPGTRALQLINLLNKKPGERLRLRLRRPSGERYDVTIIGIKKPGT